MWLCVCARILNPFHRLFCYVSLSSCTIVPHEYVFFIKHIAQNSRDKKWSDATKPEWKKESKQKKQRACILSVFYRSSFKPFTGNHKKLPMKKKQRLNLNEEERERERQKSKWTAHSLKTERHKNTIWSIQKFMRIPFITHIYASNEMEIRWKQKQRRNITPNHRCAFECSENA